MKKVIITGASALVALLIILTASMYGYSENTAALSDATAAAPKESEASIMSAQDNIDLSIASVTAEPKAAPTEAAKAPVATPTASAKAASAPKASPKAAAKATPKPVKKTATTPKPTAKATPKPAAQPVASSVASAIINTAKSYLNVPYVWGGTSAQGFDCSGFIQYVYGKHGVSLPRVTSDQYNAGTAISKSSLKPGDLVFFETYKPGASHVGIYLGNNQFIHASSGAGKVIISNLTSTYYIEHYIGSRRVLN